MLSKCEETCSKKVTVNKKHILQWTTQSLVDINKYHKGKQKAYGEKFNSTKEKLFSIICFEQCHRKSTHLLIGLCRKQRQNGNISFTQLNMKAKKFVLHI